MVSWLPACSTTSSVWPTRIEAAFVVSVTVTSKFKLEPVLGLGLGPEAVPAFPQPEMSKAAAKATSTLLISAT